MSDTDQITETCIREGCSREAMTERKIVQIAAADERSHNDTRSMLEKYRDLFGNHVTVSLTTGRQITGKLYDDPRGKDFVWLNVADTRGRITMFVMVAHIIAVETPPERLAAADNAIRALDPDA